MKKITFLVLGLSMLFTMFAQVDQGELESAEYGGVEFKSYQGPHTKIDSLADIRGIGSLMSAAVENGSYRYYSKYSMVHEYDPDEKELFSGDILILNENAGVDHIDNLRHILSAYLESAYDYKSDDARVLAVFITYYNAVYRGNLNYFSGKYIPGVLSHLTEDKVGIAVEYQEWPGKTQMVIPLSPSGRSGGSLNTDILTEEEVVESLREEEGMNLDVRKEMTEIKEQEIQEEEEAIEETRQDLEKKKEELDDTREEIAEREQALGDKDPEASETVEERREIEKEKEELAEEEEALKDAEEELEEREERQEERLEQIKEEREQIAEDEQSELEAETGTDSGTVKKTVEKENYSEVPFLLLSVNPLEPGTMALVRPDSGETEASSSMTTIQGGRFYDFAGGYLVVAGEESGNRIISLVLLDKESLDVSLSASVSVSPFTKVFIDDDTAYATVRYEGKWIPGCFDHELELTAVYEDEVLPHGNLVVEDGFLIFQDKRARLRSVSIDEMTAP